MLLVEAAQILQDIFCWSARDKHSPQRLLCLLYTADIVVCCWTIWKQKIEGMFVMNRLADLMSDINDAFCLNGNWKKQLVDLWK